MVDQVVSADAVEAIVPLLTLAKDIGEDRGPGIEDIEKEACYAIGLLASRRITRTESPTRGPSPALCRASQEVPTPDER